MLLVVPAPDLAATVTGMRVLNSGWRHWPSALYFLPNFLQSDDGSDILVTSAGMRVLNPGWRHWPSALDIFPNFRLVPKIQCPVLIMHVSWLWLLLLAAARLLLAAVRAIHVCLALPGRSAQRNAVWAGDQTSAGCAAQAGELKGCPSAPNRASPPKQVLFCCSTCKLVLFHCSMWCWFVAPQGLEDEVIDVQHGRQVGIAAVLCCAVLHYGLPCRAGLRPAEWLPAQGWLPNPSAFLATPLHPYAAAQAVQAAERAAVGAAAGPPRPGGQPR